MGKNYIGDVRVGAREVLYYLLFAGWLILGLVLTAVLL